MIAGGKALVADAGLPQLAALRVGDEAARLRAQPVEQADGSDFHPDIGADHLGRDGTEPADRARTRREPGDVGGARIGPHLARLLGCGVDHFLSLLNTGSLLRWVIDPTAHGHRGVSVCDCSERQGPQYARRCRRSRAMSST
jgi:hypothetical protein